MLCVVEPLVAFTVTWNVPVGVPLTTPRFDGADDPPPGAGFVTTTGYCPMVAISDC